MPPWSPTWCVGWGQGGAAGINAPEAASPRTGILHGEVLGCGLLLSLFNFEKCFMGISTWSSWTAVPVLPAPVFKFRLRPGPLVPGARLVPGAAEVQGLSLNLLWLHDMGFVLLSLKSNSASP